ncbi:hypothetical protein [Methylobacterium sp. B1]|uniref:hypothetical protein n=1 Tax=Methylobacterium sp. B1 TaxID=91459 RepID=UPI0005BD9791|nr:hypothetical protein [Methylobacterium sp. B1]
MLKKLAPLLLLLFPLSAVPAWALPVGLKCELIKYTGPDSGYKKFDYVDLALLDVDNQRVDMISSGLREEWTYLNGKAGTTAAGDRLSIASDSSTIYGGGIRFGSAFAFEYNRTNHALVWTGIWSHRRDAQTWLFNCLEARP